MASWTAKAAIAVSGLTLVGTIFTGAISLSGDADDAGPASNRRCTIQAVDTARGIDAYDRLLMTNRISIQQYERLVNDAIEDQVSDNEGSC